MTTTRKSVNSIKKLRESLFSSEEEIQFGANTVFSEPEAKPLEDTLSKEYYVREQRNGTLVASIVEDITNLVQDAFIEVGATKAMVDDEFKRRLIEEFIQDNLTSWTLIHRQLDDEKNKECLRAMMWHHVCVQFPNHSHPFSSIRLLLADSFFHGICIIAKVMTSPSSSIFSSVHDIRLFEYKAFRDLWKKVLHSCEYLITDVDIGILEEGTRVHGEMCVHPDSVLAILGELGRSSSTQRNSRAPKVEHWANHSPSERVPWLTQDGNDGTPFCRTTSN
jgi:hypothetical protein